MMLNSRYFLFSESAIRRILKSAEVAWPARGDATEIGFEPARDESIEFVSE
jgi:hypothetical protein